MKHNEKAAGTPQSEKLFTTGKRDAKPAKLTAEQYLKTVNFDVGIAGLIHSMYGTKIMFPVEWEAAVKNLLNRQVR